MHTDHWVTFTILVMMEVVVRVTVNFLDYYLLFCSYFEVMSGGWCGALPLFPTSGSSQVYLEQGNGGQGLGWSFSHSPSTTSGEGGLQWSDLEMRSDIAPETDSQDSLDHGVRPEDVEAQHLKKRGNEVCVCLCCCCCLC